MGSEAMARGRQDAAVNVLGIVNMEDRIPATHPIRMIRCLADRLLAELSPLFDQMYSEGGRPSIPPERLLKANLLMAIFSVRSDRLFCEQLEYNLRYRWFLGMDMIEPSFDHSTFTKNRGRLLEHAVAEEFFALVVQLAKEQQLLSDDHFTVDGTLIEAAASHKSFRLKPLAGEGEVPVVAEAAPVGEAMDDDPGNPTRNFRNEKRSNATHVSTTDPESRLAKKSAGKEAKLAFGAHALMENRNGILVDLQVAIVTGTAERDAVPVLLERARAKGFHPTTLGADKGYDTNACVAAIRERGVSPHVAQNISKRRGSAIGEETTQHEGYAISQRKRKLVEEIFGWGKTIGGLRRTRFRGVRKTQDAAYVIGAAYNLIRISRLISAQMA